MIIAEDLSFFCLQFFAFFQSLCKLCFPLMPTRLRLLYPLLRLLQ